MQALFSEAGPVNQCSEAPCTWVLGIWTPVQMPDCELFPGITTLTYVLHICLTENRNFHAGSVHFSGVSRKVQSTLGNEWTKEVPQDGRTWAGGPTWQYTWWGSSGSATRASWAASSKQHCLLSEATLLAFCCAQLKWFPRTNPDVTFCLEGKVSTLTVPGYTIYKHADADY